MGRTSRPWGQSQLRALRIWFSGRARVVYHDYDLYRYYITPLSVIYLLCPSPRLSILYCGICVSPLPRFFYSIVYLRRDLGRVLGD